MDEDKLRRIEEQTRRHFLKNCSLGLGGMVFSSFLTNCNLSSSGTGNSIFGIGDPLAPKAPHYPGKVKNVIYIHMAGAPSQLELFDYKPELIKFSGQECPQSFIEGKKRAPLRGRVIARPQRNSRLAVGETASNRTPRAATDNGRFLRHRP